ncbi:MAG: radical SAM protein, partial [Chitinophagia bacterium]|nr:radical SAM protein [Chitinophagia bacterium]
LSVTTNGVVTAPLVPELVKIGVKSVNLSLDTLDEKRFLAITHRNEFAAVMNTLHALLDTPIAVKINAVVMEQKNLDDLLPLVALTEKLPLSVRFIEEMPFNGGETHYNQLVWDFARILDTIQSAYPTLTKLPDPPGSTAYNYHIPGHAGSIGIIAAYTRSFCGTCNRLRITPQGTLKTCLYDGGALDLRRLLRSAATDSDIAQALQHAVAHKAVDGWAAEHSRMEGGVHESMATIGG